MLLSGMESSSKYRILIPLIVSLAATPFSRAQNPQRNSPPSVLDRLNTMMGGGKSAWTPEQLETMERLRDAAMKDRFALDELRHLTDNIGPRLSGSAQAQAAVDYVAAE